MWNEENSAISGLPFWYYFYVKPSFVRSMFLPCFTVLLCSLKKKTFLAGKWESRFLLCYIFIFRAVPFAPHLGEQCSGPPYYLSLANLFSSSDLSVYYKSLSKLSHSIKPNISCSKLLNVLTTTSYFVEVFGPLQVYVILRTISHLLVSESSHL